jgi:acetyl-CoA C-acetyltransferase
MHEPVIVSAVRTPIGRFQGVFNDLPATQLGARVVRAAVERAGIDPGQVEEVIMGNVVSAGLGQNPARQAALGGGLPDTVAAVTINKVCGSGLKAVGMAAQSIQTGDAEVVVAGGMESMSNCPYLLPKARKGYRLGHGTVLDSMIHDGLWDVYEDFHMGNTGEIVAGKYSVSRERQDRYALGSHQKAVAAARAGHFRQEILPVELNRPGRETLRVDADEGPRPDASMEGLGKLKPAFKKDGTVTAGNASGINDGAAAVVVMEAGRARASGCRPIARIVGQSVSGIEPALVMMAPVEAVRRLTKRLGWALQDVDLFELNEAFAVQAIAVIETLGLDAERVNVNGGAVALGHPIGASGARILVTLLHEMQRRDAKRGIATLCLGGGNAVALALER